MRNTTMFTATIATALITFSSQSILAASGPNAGIDPGKESIGVTDRQVTIGSCIPLTGVLGTRGQHVLEGAKVYFSSMNDAGGIYGRNIKLISCDDGYDPNKAIECFSSCLKDKVFAAAFCLGSPAISKYVRMSETEHTPLLGVITGTPAAYEFRKTVFTFRPSYQDEVHYQIKEMWRHGIRRYAVIYQDDAAGAGVRETVVKDLKANGTSPVGEASFPRTDVHIEPALAEIKKTHPELVIVVGATGTVQTIKKRYEQKWRIPFATYDIQRPYFEGTKEGEGLMATHVLPGLDSNLPGVQLYLKLMKKYAPESKPNEPGFEGFLNARIIVEGLKNAGRDLTRSRFIQGVESIHSLDLGPGPRYRVSYSPQNHNGLTEKAIFLSVMHDGKYIPINENGWKTVVKDSKSGVE